MQAVETSCNDCQAKLRFSVDPATKPVVRLKCPKCGKLISLDVRELTSKKQDLFVPPPAKPKPTVRSSETSFAGNSSDAGSLPSYSPHADFSTPLTNWQASVAPYTRRRKSADLRWVWISGGVLGGILCLTLFGYGLYRFLPTLIASLPEVTQIPNPLGPGSSAPAPSFSLWDTREGLLRELVATRKEMAARGGEFSEEERLGKGADLMEKYAEKLKSLQRRSANLARYKRNVADYQEMILEDGTETEAGRDAMAAGLTRLGIKLTGDLEWAQFFSIKVDGSELEDRWKKAINQSAYWSLSAALLIEGNGDFESPLEYQGDRYNWTQEDRRILALVHAQARTYQALLLPLYEMTQAEEITDGMIDRCYSLLDKAAQDAKAVVDLPNEQSGMFIQAPRRTPYDFQLSVASAAYQKFALEIMGRQKEATPKKIEFIFSSLKKITEALNGAQHGYKEDFHKLAETTVAERFQKHTEAIAAEEVKRKREEELKELARVEAERSREEKVRLAEARRREDAKQAEIRRQEAAERDRQYREEHPQPQDLLRPSPGGGGRGPRGGRGSIDGPRPREALGGPRSWGADPPQPVLGPEPKRPPSTPPDPSKSVVIVVSPISSEIYERILERIKGKFSNYRFSRDNDRARLTIDDFGGDLATLEELFPELEFSEFNKDSRTATAKMK